MRKVLSIHTRKTILILNIVVLSTILLSACASPLPDNAITYQLKQTWGTKGKAQGEFNEPTGIALTPTEVFVSDARNRRVQVFDYNGRFLREFGNTGSKSAQLGRPMNLAIGDDKVFVADYFNDQIKIYTLEGNFIQAIGSAGDQPGQFNAPVGVDITDQGELIVADFYNQRIQQLKPDGSFIRQWGTTGKTGIWSGEFNYPTDVAISKAQRLYVADGYNDRVQVFDNSGKYSHKWGGLFGMNISGKKPGWFTTVTSIKVGADNNIYVADFYNDRVQIFTPKGKLLNVIKVESSGVQHSAIAVAVTADSHLFIVNHGKHEIQFWEKQ